MDIEAIYNIILWLSPIAVAMFFSPPPPKRRQKATAKVEKKETANKKAKAKKKKKPRRQKRAVAPTMSPEQQALYDAYQIKRTWTLRN